MSVRIGIYDFFAYTVPGIFYILVIIYGLTVFGFTRVDLNMINNISLFSIFVIIGAGYIVGLLLDFIAYQWVKLFIGRNGIARRQAFESFHKHHPWLELNFEVEDWTLLLSALKSKSTEGIMDIEMHNVVSIMLRNISLGLILVSAIFMMYFVFVNTNLWNLVFTVIAITFSRIAIDRCGMRRRWFYSGIFEAFVAFYVFQDESVGDRKYVKYKEKESKAQRSDASAPHSDSSEIAVESEGLSVESNQPNSEHIS